MKIAVIGATDVALVVTSFLQDTPDEVALFDVPSQNITVNKQLPCEITVRGTSHQAPPIIYLKSLDELQGYYDYVFLFTAPNVNQTVFSALAQHLHTKTVIVSFQKTLYDESLIQHFSPNVVISAVCHFHAYYKSPGTVFLTTNLVDMALHGFDISCQNMQKTEDLLEVKNLLDYIAQTYIIAHKNIKWSHALLLVSVDHLASALNCLYGDILYHNVALQAAIHLADEIVRVAEKYAIPLTHLNDIDLNTFVIDSDTKIEELSIVLKLLIEPHRTSESSFIYDDTAPIDLIDELITMAKNIDQPIPYLESLSHCLYFSQQAQFHDNILIFEPLVKGLPI